MSKKCFLWAMIVVVLLAATGCSGSDTDNESVANDDMKVEESISAADKVLESSNEDNFQQEMTTLEETKFEGTELKVEMTEGQKKALELAKFYIGSSPLSYEGLIGRLEFDKHSHEDAVFAADNCGADWDEQAIKAADLYLESDAFAYKGLVERLESVGFTKEQATYAADSCGADWNEQAAKAAKTYLDLLSCSEDELIDFLESVGFTKEQAEYGVKENGYK